MDCLVRGVAKIRISLSNFHFTLEEWRRDFRRGNLERVNIDNSCMEFFSKGKEKSGARVGMEIEV